MPKNFTECVKRGGRVFTRKVSAEKYQHICERPGGETGPRGGRTVSGEIKTKKTKK